MGEGGGFPQVRAVVSLANSELPVACPSTKGAPECELTNLLVDLMQVQEVTKACPLPSPIPNLQHTPLPVLVLRAGSVPSSPHNSAILETKAHLGLNLGLGSVS